MKLKYAAKIILIIIMIIILGLIAVILRQGVINSIIEEDYNSIYSNEKYSQKVSVDGIELIKQDISCGYACIEMIGNYFDYDIPEEILLKENDGKISTAMGNGFCNEMNGQFPKFNTTKYKHLPYTDLLDMIYSSLSSDMPVPIEFAAKYYDGNTEVWTLHFALVTAMDIPNDTITVYNPYGYIEEYSISEFLDAVSYKSYENMPMHMKLGFAAGIFSKNTIYMIE